MTRAEKPKVFHRDFLGAHRYTTGGGTARPAGGVLRTAVVCRGQPRGDTTFPLRCLRTYPYVYFPLGKALKSRAELKTIYEQYFTSRTKEFIALLRENVDMTYPELLNVMKEKGKTPAAYSVTNAAEDNVVTNTRKQLQRISSIYKKGGSEYVN